MAYRSRQGQIPRNDSDPSGRAKSGRARVLFAVAFMGLGFSVPILPRLVVASQMPDGAELLGQWWEQVRLASTHRPARLLLDWLWVLSPHVLLATCVLAVLCPARSLESRRSNAAGFCAAALGITVVGWFLCGPVRGMGMSFYWGEMLFPLFALPAAAVFYVVGRLAYRWTRLPTRSCQSEIRNTRLESPTPEDPQ